MDSFTTQDCTHYSTAPFDWITDSNLYDNTQANNLTPGLFLKNDNPLQNNIDKESSLIGLENTIGRCENVDVKALNKAKELSSGLQRIYNVSNSKIQNKQMFLNNTRLTQPSESISELDFNRFIDLHNNPQEVNNIIEDLSFSFERGGSWSRNDFKDNYTCSVSDNRGGNHK